jgi:hypothetical protein
MYRQHIPLAGHLRVAGGGTTFVAPGTTDSASERDGLNRRIPAVDRCGQQIATPFLMTPPADREERPLR